MSSGIDYPLGETVHLLFTTRAFATGIPGTLSAATVAVYEDGTATPIMTSVAVTESLNSIAGLNMVPIVATGGNGFNAGASYHVVIEAGTVDSVSVVGEVIGSFSIQRAPVNWAEVTAPTTAVDLSATDIQLADTITTYTGNTLQTGDVTTAINDLANGTDGLGAIKAVVDGIPTTAMRGTDSAATAVELAKVPKSDSNVSWNATALAAINAEADTALTDYDPPTRTEATSDKAEIVTDIAAIQTDTTNLGLGIIYGAAATGTLSTTVCTSDLTGYLDDELIGRAIIFTGGTADGQASDITDYASASGTVTFTAIPTAPANLDTFKIV